MLMLMDGENSPESEQSGIMALFETGMGIGDAGNRVSEWYIRTIRLALTIKFPGSELFISRLSIVTRKFFPAYMCMRPRHCSDMWMD